ncbi:MAG TPA: hypothetical protein VL485_07090 [Ktedonobacteraceae bacterium]|nr:hypothetical protein [Ktedonobacteraceae bacterium]
MERDEGEQILARCGTSHFLLATTNTPTCDNDLNNTAWADAHGLIPLSPTRRKGTNLRAPSCTGGRGTRWEPERLTDVHER